MFQSYSELILSARGEVEPVDEGFLRELETAERLAEIARRLSAERIEP